MMSKQRDPKTVMRYDHSRKNLIRNAVDFLEYDKARRGQRLTGGRERKNARPGLVVDIVMKLPH